VRYGGAPHAHGFYGYPYGYAGPRYYGVGRGYYGPSWYAPPVYVQPSLSVTFWGYGGCGCAPYYEPAPVYAPVPVWHVEPAPPVVIEAPPQGYVAPAPDPYQAPAPQPPVVEEALPEQAPGFPPPSPAAPEAPADPVPAEEGQHTLSPEDEQALRQSLDDFRAGRYGAAQATLEAVAARTPQLGHAWLGIAHAAFAMDRYGRASEALTQAAKLGAFPRGYAFDPRALYAKPDDFLGRKQALERHVTAAPQDANARLVLAWLRVSLGERDLARADLDAVLALRPTDEAAPLLSLALLPALPQAQGPAPLQQPGQAPGVPSQPR
jgi:hypothetical protein